MGSSHARVVSLFAEPIVLLVLFTVALIAHIAIPFIVNQTLTSPAYLGTPCPQAAARPSNRASALSHASDQR